MDDHFAYQRRVFEGYEHSALQLISSYENLSQEAVLGPLVDFLPGPDAHVLDVGAGPGALAAWLVEHGFLVTAVEPVARFRDHAQTTYRHLEIEWFDASLPNLTNLPKDQTSFDAALAIGVLHHLNPQDQKTAIEALATRLKPSGRLILSLRHGPCPVDRPGFPICADDLVTVAQHAGLKVLHRSGHASLQEGNRHAGVTWTKLVFEAA